MTGLGGPAQPIESSEGIKIPVTTGELPTQEQPVAPERVVSDIKPPEAPAASVQVPVQGEDEAMKTALGNLDKVAEESKVAPSGLEIRGEDTGEPVAIKTEQTTQAVNDSLKGRNPESLEALVSTDFDPEPQPDELPTPAMPVEPPAEFSQAPIEAAVQEPAPVAAPAPIAAEPTPPPVVTPPAPAEKAAKETPPDAGPVITGEPRTISRAEENEGTKLALEKVSKLREGRDRAEERISKLIDDVRRTSDIQKQADIEIEIMKARREAEGYEFELTILLNNLAFYIDRRVGSSDQEQGPGGAGGVK